MGNSLGLRQIGFFSLQVLLGFNLFRNVRGQSQRGRAPQPVQVVGSDFDSDSGSVFFDVFPLPFSESLRMVGDRGQQRWKFLRRANIQQGHSQKLLARITVLFDRGQIDGQEGQGVQVNDPHGLRVSLEHQTIRRIQSRHSISRVFASARFFYRVLI